jgi:DNA polymerase I-like protein with 3'-5' exonuclease and polymerase domains
MTRLVTLDFETYYDQKTFSLSKMTTESYIRDPRFEVIGVGVKVDDYPTDWFSGSKEEIKEWLNILDWSDINLLCHHTAFDGAILNWHFGIKPKYYFDTLSMARPLHGLTVGGSLAALAKHYGLPAKGTEVIKASGKTRRQFDMTELREYGEYCKNDVEITRMLFDILKTKTTTKEMYIIDLMLRMFTDPVLELNKDILTSHLTSVRDKKQKLMDRIDETIGRESLMSNPKFAEVLTKLGVAPPMKTSLRTGKETYAFGKTDVEFKALLEHEDERVQAVVAARFGVKSTLEETRTEAFIGIAERGPLPIMLNYYGAHTGRASGGDKVNLQNLPRGGALRQSIQAPAGHSLVASDSSQIEARVVAWLAGETDLVRAFAEGRDIYSEFATDVYGKTVTKADKVERFVGKTCILGLGYGMGKDKFKSALKIGMGGISVDVDIDEAERVVKLYRSKYPMIAKLWKDGQEALEAIAKGREYYLGTAQLKCDAEGIHLPNGMKVIYPELRLGEDNNYEYKNRYGFTKIYGGKLIENVVQALARIVVFDQMAKIDQTLRKNDKPGKRAKVVLTVHDEVVAVVPDSDAANCMTMMVEYMKQAPSWCADLPVACEADIGKSYGDAK